MRAIAQLMLRDDVIIRAAILAHTVNREIFVKNFRSRIMLQKLISRNIFNSEFTVRIILRAIPPVRARRVRSHLRLCSWFSNV